MYNTGPERPPTDPLWPPRPPNGRRPHTALNGPQTAPTAPDGPGRPFFKKKYVKVIFLNYLFTFTIK